MSAATQRHRVEALSGADVFGVGRRVPTIQDRRCNDDLLKSLDGANFNIDSVTHHEEVIELGD
jgi:hypothetical protein